MVDKKVWLVVGKTLLVLCPICLAATLWLASCVNRLERSMQAFENVRHDLVERRIDLMALKDRLSSPERVLSVAALELALYVPEKEQKNIFD